MQIKQKRWAAKSWTEVWWSVSHLDSEASEVFSWLTILKVAVQILDLQGPPQVAMAGGPQQTAHVLMRKQMEEEEEESGCSSPLQVPAPVPEASH